MEYIKKAVGSSGTAKTGLGLGIAGTALGILNSGGGLGLFNNGFAGAPVQAAIHGGYVTEKEMSLIRENSAQGSELAQLKAEKYADNLVKCEVEPVKTRVCELEKLAAVNAARDHDFRRYVEAAFVHQPKAEMNDLIVTCQQNRCGCDCGHGHGHC